MTQTIAIIKLILSLLPAIIEAVKAIEAALPVSGQGAAKLGVIRATLAAGWGVANDTIVAFEKAWPAIETAVGAAVGLFNAAGTFRKG